MMNKPASPMIQAARLFQNVSAKSGATYFTGRWGSLKVVIFENRSHNPGDPLQNHTHNMMLTEAAPYQPKPEQADTAPVLPFPPARSSPPRQSRPDDRFKKRAGGGRTELVDDPMPFGPETR